ncbi:MAG TPA: GAF domain-containing protein, partial [Candidatus Binatia bacterium]
KLVGVLTVVRNEAQAFTQKQIELVETFADQAVIAIENVRLFQELQERTRDLARSVDELKALGEVGQAVSSTLDLQTVLNTIVGRAVQLSGTDCGTGGGKSIADLCDAVGVGDSKRAALPRDRSKGSGAGGGKSA